MIKLLNCFCTFVATIELAPALSVTDKQPGHFYLSVCKVCITFAVDSKPFPGVAILW